MQIGAVVSSESIQEFVNLKRGTCFINNILWWTACFYVHLLFDTYLWTGKPEEKYVRLEFYSAHIRGGCPEITTRRNLDWLRPVCLHSNIGWMGQANMGFWCQLVTVWHGVYTVLSCSKQSLLDGRYVLLYVLASFTLPCLTGSIYWLYSYFHLLFSYSYQLNPYAAFQSHFERKPALVKNKQTGTSLLSAFTASLVKYRHAISAERSWRQIQSN